MWYRATVFSLASACGSHSSASAPWEIDAGSDTDSETAGADDAGIGVEDSETTARSDAEHESDVATDVEPQDVESTDVTAPGCTRDEDCPTGGATQCFVGACVDGACLAHARPGTCMFVNPGDGTCFNGTCVAGQNYLRGQQAIPAAAGCECRRLR